MAYRISGGARLAGIWLLGLLASAQGAEDEQTASDEQDLPDLEFLEFLGSFETDEGEWIDPGSLLSDEFNELLDATVIIGANAAKGGAAADGAAARRRQDQDQDQDQDRE